jgi:hypothetical protein
VRCDDKRIYVTLRDGREVSKPLLPFLRTASAKARENCRVVDFATAILWPDLDEMVGLNWFLGVREDTIYDLAGFKSS